MIFLYFYLLLIMGSFGNLVGKNLMARADVPFGMIAVVLMGILAGQMTYKWKRDIILTTVVTVVLTFVGIWLSTQPFIISLSLTVRARYVHLLELDDIYCCVPARCDEVSTT